MIENAQDISQGQEKIKDALESNGEYLRDIRDLLSGQIDLTEDLAEKEKIRYETEKFQEAENLSEQSRGGPGFFDRVGSRLDRGIAGFESNVLPRFSPSNFLPKALVSGLLLNYAEEINSFLSKELTAIFEAVDLPEDVEAKITEIAGSYGAQLAASGVIGSIFGLRGAIAGIIGTFIWKEFGLERLLTEEGREDFFENVGQEIRDKFAEMANPGLVGGATLGVLFASLGFKKLGLATIAAGLIFDFFGLNQLLTDEGRENFLNDIKTEFDTLSENIDTSDVVTGLTALMAPVLAMTMMRGLRGAFRGAGAAFSGMFPAVAAGGTAAAAAGISNMDQPARTATVESYLETSRQTRINAANQALSDVSDDALRSAGYQRTRAGIQRLGGGGFASSAEMESLVRSQGRTAQYAQNLGGSAITASSPAKKASITKSLTKFNKILSIPGIGVLLNVGFFVMVISDESLSNQEKIRLLGSSLGTQALASFGAILGTAFGWPVVGTIVGGVIGWAFGDDIAMWALSWLFDDSTENVEDVWNNNAPNNPINNAEVPRPAGLDSGPLALQYYAAAQSQQQAQASQMSPDRVEHLQQSMRSRDEVAAFNPENLPTGTTPLDVLQTSGSRQYDPSPNLSRREGQNQRATELMFITSEAQTAALDALEYIKTPVQNIDMDANVESLVSDYNDDISAIERFTKHREAPLMLRPEEIQNLEEIADAVKQRTIYLNERARMQRVVQQSIITQQNQEKRRQYQQESAADFQRRVDAAVETIGGAVNTGTDAVTEYVNPPITQVDLQPNVSSNDVTEYVNPPITQVDLQPNVSSNDIGSVSQSLEKMSSVAVLSPTVINYSDNSDKSQNISGGTGGGPTSLPSGPTKDYDRSMIGVAQ